MRRDTADRVRMIGEIQRPKRPKNGAPTHHFNHHAVHLAACWVHELTDFGIKPYFDRLDQARKDGTILSKDDLHEIAKGMLDILSTNHEMFTSQDYASIYHHVSKGLKNGN